MAKRRLNEKQMVAIAILAQPKRGGMTYDEIAKEVGVARSTLFEWKKQDVFIQALKEEIVRNTLDRLPEVLDSIPDHIIRDGNAALLRILMQAHGLLTEKVEVDSKGTESADLDVMRAEIERLRKERKSE